MKNIISLAAFLLVSVFLAGGSANAQNNLNYGGSLRGKLIGIEQVLPNGNIVVADIVYGDADNKEIGAVYLYDQTRTTILSTLKGAKSGDRIGSGGINVLPNGDFEVFSPEWRDADSNNTGAVTICSQTSGCDAEISRTNSRFDIGKPVSAKTKAAVAPEMLAPQAGAAVFDSITGATSFSAPTATRTFMGQAYNLAAGTTDLNIASFRNYLASLSTTNYTNIVLNIQFWGAVDTTATPVFSNPSTLYSFSLGAGNLAANNIYDITGDFTPLQVLPNTTNLGITFNYRGDTGAGLTSTDNLTTAVRGGSAAPPIAVGSTPVNGYFRNASGRTDFNFNADDLRNIGSNSALAFALYNAVPTAAPIVISGRVTDGKRALANASVALSDASGNVRTARTNAFGHFAFSDVEAGATYVVNVAAKRFSFAPQVISSADNVTDLVFSPQ